MRLIGGTGSATVGTKVLIEFLAVPGETAFAISVLPVFLMQIRPLVRARVAPMQ